MPDDHEQSAASAAAWDALTHGEPLVDEILAVIEPMMVGRGPELQAYVLAELAAIFIAGHKTDDQDSTELLRCAVYDQWISLVRNLVPIVAKQRGIDPDDRTEKPPPQ
ncbi:MAG: hypothetical protein J2P55_00645 [Rhizobiales bacterium]|nr:hypothetical protein [Hyphomicrobiales bacterium]